MQKIKHSQWKFLQKEQGSTSLLYDAYNFFLSEAMFTYTDFILFLH